ncbi:hypothetical protein [Lignipirellula cremea]|uniref:Uncharacterized protein n=1 Tax=Lignipirellula cremea TaxID=2528010 RepID=A0A518DYN4_9BACT|nr:hypothetical protein [Lignipirellula cremea]QDU96959.1 hypothetical protein Pla8534_47840 [Lignipirellula cremea]
MRLSSRFQEWSKSCFASKQKYVWQIGVLGFGLPMGLWFVFAIVRPELSDLSLGAQLLLEIPATLLFGLACGWCWGQAMWALRPFWYRPTDASKSPPQG